MIDWTHDKIAELIALVRFGAVLIAVASVAYAYAKTRSLVTLLVAALTAGIFLWAINNTDWWQQRVEDESGLPRHGPVETAPGYAAEPTLRAGVVTVWEDGRG